MHDRSWPLTFLSEHRHFSNSPGQSDVYSIQYYVIKFVSDLRQVGGFLGYSGFLHQQNWPPRYNWNVIEMLLNTITLTPI
jgi:hypothetical protein